MWGIYIFFCTEQISLHHNSNVKYLHKSKMRISGGFGFLEPPYAPCRETTSCPIEQCSNIYRPKGSTHWWERERSACSSSSSELEHSSWHSRTLRRWITNSEFSCQLQVIFIPAGHFEHHILTHSYFCPPYKYTLTISLHWSAMILFVYH